MEEVSARARAAPRCHVSGWFGGVVWVCPAAAVDAGRGRAARFCSGGWQCRFPLFLCYFNQVFHTLIQCLTAAVHSNREALAPKLQLGQMFRWIMSDSDGTDLMVLDAHAN